MSELDQHVRELRASLREVNDAYTHLLFVRLARKLTGRQVKLMFTGPPMSGVKGLTVRDGDALVIYIKPDQDDLFRCYLHECAHGKLHAIGMAQLADIQRVPEVRQATGKQVEHPDWLMEQRRQAHSQREAEASAQTSAWLSAATGGNLNARLLALLEIQT